MRSKKTNYDVVVIGTGAAGMAAGLTAVQDGHSVLMLEKGKTTGGSTNYTEGLFAIDSYLQKEEGIKIKATDVLSEEVNYSKYKADSRIWRDYINSSAENVQWLHEQGVEYEGVQAMGAGEATWHIYKGMGFGVIHDALQPRFEQAGGEILTLTRAVNLQKKDNGDIEVTLRDNRTKEHYRVSARTVVLATGGYLNNERLIKEETSYDERRLVPVSSGKGTGDGLEMAWHLGAQKNGMGMAMLFGGYLKDEQEPSYKMMSSQMNTAAGQQPLLWVNENGERFVNEEVVYNFSLAGNALYTQAQVYSILDQAVIDKMATEGNFMGLGIYVRRGQKMDKLQAELDQAVAAKKSFIFKANTIAELAKQMQLPVANLQETINRYNKFADQGVDSDFGKESQYLQKVTTGPFYGFKLNVGAFCTMGGLKVTPENQVLDTNYKPIPGLYAAGNDASGLVGDTYGPNMPGTCVGYAFYSGRNAAHNINKYL
ncbi:FAD-dependent oxidoreductase [Limosilactobacillus rudii]|nr:FAD-binding protein [Limosilactobacillus rudii]